MNVLIKKYARKMENLAKVRDGSENKIGNGCWTRQVVAAECGEPEIVPLYHVFYSQEASDFVSENDELMKAIIRVGSTVGNRWIFVLDRGSEREAIYKHMVPRDRGLRFIIRQHGDPILLYRGKKVKTGVSGSAEQNPSR